jgi:hypothetical protein
LEEQLESFLSQEDLSSLVKEVVENPTNVNAANLIALNIKESAKNERLKLNNLKEITLTQQHIDANFLWMQFMMNQNNLPIYNNEQCRNVTSDNFIN